MINYTIDIIRGREVKITYSKEGKNDYSAYATFSSDTPSVEEFQELVKEHSYEILHIWEQGEVTDVTLPQTSGSIKSSTFESQPSYNDSTQKLEPLITETDTTTTYGYSVVDLNDTEKGFLIRYKRDALLRNTDVFALSDRPISTAMTNYRQSLRDITSQESFPESVVWPVLPVD
jgi:hypothetical protein